MKNRNLLLVWASLAIVSLTAAKSLAHCQIPCGIYDDPARFAEMKEHVTTIEKSMKSIHELSKAEDLDYNQLVRWVMNKEDHADKLSEIVSYYFLAQRIKPADPNDPAAMKKYVKELRLLHEMIVTAMKAKQTTDLAHVEKLRTLIDQFEASYFGQAAHTHSHDHGTHSHAGAAAGHTH